MKIINPITWAASMLTSSTVAETDYTAWSNATAYVVGDKCILTSTHRIYEALVNNTNAQPDTNLTGDTPKWLDLGATNRFKMFDDKFGTQTTATTTMTVVVTPGLVIDSLALLNMVGDSVVISCTDPVAGAIYSKTIPLQTDIGVWDWKTYFMAPIVAEDDIIVSDLLPYRLQAITITITGTGTVAIGNIALGAYVDLGGTQLSPKIGIVDYSKKDADEFGNTVIVERAYSKRFSAQLVVESSFVDQLAGILASIRAKPVVWVGSDSKYASLIVWGFMKDFEIDIAYENISYCSLTVEGLT